MDIANVRDLMPEGDPDHAYRAVLASKHLSVGFATWRAGSVDSQQPHEADEVYHVVSGRARIRVGSEEQAVGPGSIIFVAAGVEHEFFDIQETLQVLVSWAPPHARDVEELAGRTR